MAALAHAAGAAVASLDKAHHPVEAQPSKRGRELIIPQPTDLRIPRLTDVSGAFLFYAFYNWTG